MPQADQQVRLLGPVDIRLGPTEQQVAGTRRKAVLALLALNAGQTVSVDRLIDIVWTDSPPATAANTLQSHVSHLRGLFRSRDAIVAVAPGYRLDLAGDTTDLITAQRLIAAAGRAERPDERVAQLRSALALWRARPLADLAGSEWFDAQAERIERVRSDAFNALIDARLNLGEHAALVPELEQLASQHPFDEALHSQLMLALYRSGRQADAFEVYRGIRNRLLDELGIDPGRSLRDLETAMLRQDPTLDPPAAAPATIITTSTAAGALRGPDVVPAQLPPALAHFVGRQAEFDRLDEALAGGGASPSALICAVSGPPGVGKTSFAVAWAHQVAGRFPDGQLYVNLRGFDPRAVPVDPAEVLHGFLEALGVSSQRIPDGIPARVGLYRSMLAGKRVLVVLDNAHDADQVRPLLPGSATCVVVITSRNKLTSLVATEGAVAMPVELLSRDEAHALLAQRLGQKRIINEPDAVDAIISRCAGLPLALGIVAARAATEPAVSLATFAGEMEAAGDALDTLSGGDHSADVRAVISWSYALLSPESARLFRHLALHPGVAIGTAAVASLAGVTAAQARRLLGELSGANLLISLDGGRYTFHDLIRAYALEQGERWDSEEDRSSTLLRIADHYLHSAHAAAGLLDPNRDAAAPNPPLPGVTPQRLADADQALDWLITEY
ncbi:MAG TPA: BTAD domain-containing putative transcriptional regulator, partial [Micromonosporaceae bacterium]